MKTYFVVLSVSFGLDHGRVIACCGPRMARKIKRWKEEEYAKDPNGKYAVVRVFDADKVPAGLTITV